MTFNLSFSQDNFQQASDDFSRSIRRERQKKEEGNSLSQRTFSQKCHNTRSHRIVHIFRFLCVRHAPPTIVWWFFSPQLSFAISNKRTNDRPTEWNDLFCLFRALPAPLLSPCLLSILLFFSFSMNYFYTNLSPRIIDVERFGGFSLNNNIILSVRCLWILTHTRSVLK